MSLVPIPPPKIGEYRLDVTPLRNSGARGLSGLALAVREPGTNALVTRLTTVHEKLFHLFIVSRDLQYFAHVHPDQKPDGTLALAHALAPGEYMLIADFLPEGGRLQMVQKAIIAPGVRGPSAARDESNGLHVDLKIEDLAPGKHACLTFRVTDKVTGAAVSDLEPYLGAPAHMLLVRGDLSDAIHAHPEEQGSQGPAVSFHPLIPAPGSYKGWIQFQRRGKISTIPFEFIVGS